MPELYISGSNRVATVFVLFNRPSRKDCLFPVTRLTQFWLPEANFFYCTDLINKLIVSETLESVLRVRFDMLAFEIVAIPAS